MLAVCDIWAARNSLIHVASFILIVNLFLLRYILICCIDCQMLKKVSLSLQHVEIYGNWRLL